jgi:hypothetical protein
MGVKSENRNPKSEGNPKPEIRNPRPGFSRNRCDGKKMAGKKWEGLAAEAPWPWL